MYEKLEKILGRSSTQFQETAQNDQRKLKVTQNPPSTVVGKYKRKTERQSGPLESKEQTARAVISGSMAYKRAADQFQVPQVTLEHYIRKKHPNPDYAVVAKRNNHPHPSKDEATGFDWVQGFLTCHPVLSLRNFEATSAASAMGFNKVAVQKFYDLLAKVVCTDHLAASTIYNCDETGVSVNAKGLSKIIANTGRRQVGTLSLGEQGKGVTVKICFLSAGNVDLPSKEYETKL
ncbi:hypothetical protein ILUMI_14849 [Ignelater luminosus]|uniref:HTH psq-type domain-containing protein n=1 Tax=Ignelater luminosus TaxID=2038154 RepID=A0A8K0CPQ8_IGNLU|nr:hypothetical protein ILUMI_14849 [Ignelater luminosus]